MRFWLVLLLLISPNAYGESSVCRTLRPAARRMKLAFPPSTPDIKNCASIEDASSNYIIATDPRSLVEMHVISVEEGSFPTGLKRSGEQDPGDAVRVIVYKTEKPAIIYLNAHKPVRWDVTITQEADVDRVVVAGGEPQVVRGVPKGIPIVRRSPESLCGRAHGWEKRLNRLGSDYRLLIQGIRCATGLRETSFQGCASGAIFEVPHYRHSDNPQEIEDWSPPCPLPVEPDVISPASGVAPAARYKNLPERSGPRLPAPRAAHPQAKRQVQADPSLRLPAAPGDLIPSYERQEDYIGQKLLPPAAVKARKNIPIRALAILVDGDKSLATFDAIPDLITALKRGDEILRSRAADELGKMGPKAGAAVDPLIRALKKDKNVRVQASAALALGNLGKDAQKAIPYLKRALQSDSADLRLSAETALERIGTEKALAILHKHRGD